MKMKEMIWKMFDILYIYWEKKIIFIKFIYLIILYIETFIYLLIIYFIFIYWVANRGKQNRDDVKLIIMNSTLEHFIK